ncbi:glutathione S-transferase [Notoacmeibacter marinus]|uniref:glutathione transferase n=1 Tax=Notoacmeibacter marinus TaxID=1876515 RepID=A0A231UXA9_9HYPH|nr:glutathione S-transferase [Notoacmeibacter marinus]OXT00512.1 glutathione S-transferase [Notoacmeibacter marinus]
MITVHYLEHSRAHRVLWLLEELGLAYELKRYERRPDMLAPRSLKEVHPLGKSPVIEDDGVIVAESGAITEYLVRKYDGEGVLKPSDEENFRRYTYWLHYAEGSAMPVLLLKLIFSVLPERTPFLVKPVAKAICKGATDKLIDPQVKDHVAFWETELQRDGYFAGSAFSAADIMMSFPVEAGIDRIEYDGETGAISQWMEAIRSRPAYQRALERGGAYRFSQSSA